MPTATTSTGTAVEAMLVSAERPVPATRLAEALAQIEGAGEPTADDVQAAIEALNTAYESSGRTFRIVEIAGGYRVMTLPEHAAAAAALQRVATPARLSRAALETLSIVAYRQPITRAELESIRGVGCGEVLRALLDRKLVKVVGRAEELGRPMLYGTTSRFLDVFGLSSLKDLPADAEPQAAPERKEST